MKTLQFTEKIEKQINYYIDDSYDLETASVWVLNDIDNAIKLTDNKDIYELLGSKTTLTKLINHKNDGFAVVTCGWAASLDDCDENMPPSQAPNKRRVRIVIGANKKGIVSILRFQDKTDEKVIDENTAKGALAEAVNNIRLHIKKRKK